MDLLFVSENSNDFFDHFQKNLLGLSTMLASPSDALRKFLSYQTRLVVFVDKQVSSDNNKILQAYNEIKSLTEDSSHLVYVGYKKDDIDCISFASANKIRSVLNFHLSRLNQLC